MTAKTLPAGVKDAKLNLSNAYRTTLTWLVAGDEVRMDPGLGRNRMTPAGTFAPKRSYWLTVTKVNKVGRQVQVTLSNGTTYTDFAHTSITRKERAAEYQDRLEDAATKRQAALDEYAAARKCGCDFGHLTETQREACRARTAAATAPLEAPAVVAERLVTLAQTHDVADPYQAARNAINGAMTAELNRGNDQRGDYVAHYLDQLIAVDALERKHDDEWRAAEEARLQDALANHPAKVTISCPRCPWETTAVRYDESVEVILGAHLVRVHSKDMADEAEELKKLQLQAARYGMLVARLDGLRMDTRAKMRETAGAPGLGDAVIVAAARMNLMDEVAALVDEVQKIGR